MKASTLAVLVILSFSGACSKVDKVEKGIADTNEKMEAVSQATSETNKTIEELSKQIRSTSSKEIRDNAFRDILNPETGFGTKKDAAVTYFKNFEFQLWDSQSKYSDASSREILIEEAVEEFLRKVSDVTAEIDIEDVDYKNPNNMEKAFLALAEGMGELHKEQVAIVERNKAKGHADAKLLSFFDIVRSTLYRESDVTAKLSGYEIELLSTESKNMFISMARTRMNHLTKEGMDFLIDKNKRPTLTQRFSSILAKVTRGRWGNTEVPEAYHQLNDATKIIVEQNFQDALEAKNFLREIKVDYDLNSDLKMVLLKLDLEHDGVENKSTDSHKEKIRGQISNLLK